MALTLFGALGGLVLAALLFLAVCAACVAVLTLLQAVLPTEASEAEAPPASEGTVDRAPGGEPGADPIAPLP